jgi:hypothetical protein
MDKRHLLGQVREAVINSQLTPEELVVLLELEVDDLLEFFPKALLNNAEKFGLFPETDTDEDDADNYEDEDLKDTEAPF